MKISLLICGILGVALLQGCGSSEAPSDPPDPVVEHRVTLLFQKDGVKVYRFYDSGNTCYYTDARGETTTFHTKREGKNTIKVRRSIPIVQ